MENLRKIQLKQRLNKALASFFHTNLKWLVRKYLILFSYSVTVFRIMTLRCVSWDGESREDTHWNSIKQEQRQGDIDQTGDSENQMVWQVFWYLFGVITCTMRKHERMNVGGQNGIALTEALLCIVSVKFCLQTRVKKKKCSSLNSFLGY